MTAKPNSYKHCTKPFSDAARTAAQKEGRVLGAARRRRWMRPEFQTETEIKLSEAAAAAHCNRAKVTLYIHMVLERLRGTCARDHTTSPSKIWAASYSTCSAAAAVKTRVGFAFLVQSWRRRPARKRNEIAAPDFPMARAPK